MTTTAQILRDNAEDIAKLDVIDNGKPIWEARMDLISVLDTLDYHGGVIPAALNGNLSQIAMLKLNYCVQTIIEISKLSFFACFDQSFRGFF